MSNSLLGSLLGFVFSLAQHWVLSRTPVTVDVPPGSVTDGSDSDDAPLAPDVPWGNRALDILRGSVRPVLTYAFFLTWVTLKLIVLVVALHQNPAVPLLSVVWGEDDAVLFATVTSYWFGARLLRRR